MFVLLYNNIWHVVFSSLCNKFSSKINGNQEGNADIFLNKVNAIELTLIISFV